MPDGAPRIDAAARAAGLVYSNDELPGLRRIGRGRGFSYANADGRPPRDKGTLARIRALAIPPAWTDVWICPRENGHIQATGRDARGRKQYRYHPQWSERRAENKFDRLTAFARALPRLRRRIEADLALRGPHREKVLATAVRMLELTLIRVGNREYVRTNRSYGLTTLHKRHLQTDGRGLTLHFKGKSGVEHRISVRDRRLARILRSLRELPGQHLFKYADEAGNLVPVTSDDVNAYIRETLGEEFSAKDFRTWAGTVSAARALRQDPTPATPSEAKRRITVCVKSVSSLLGNTPAVCRSAYVHPGVFDAYTVGRLAEALPGPEAHGFEIALVRLLEADS